MSTGRRRSSPNSPISTPSVVNTRNGTLGGAYFMIAARALGLDCGPMSGVDLAKVNAEFFPDGRCTANFLINLGWPAGPAPRARGPRLAFEQACVLA